jgi:hypothetical protein
MKNSLFIVVLLMSLHLAAQKPQTDLEKTFTSYQTAQLNNKGEDAVQYLDSMSIDYFKMILDKVRGADSVAIEALPLSGKFNVLMIRHLATKKEILAFTPTTMTAFAFNHGMGKSKLEGATLGKAKIKGNNAKAPLLENGKKTDTQYEFNLEDSLWKIDVLPLMEESEADIKAMINGKSENEFIFDMLELMTGKAPTKAIWKKIK